MLSMLGGIVGDTAVWRAQSEYAKAWRFKHPSPWDYAFFMSNALHSETSAGSGTTGCSRPSRSTDRFSRVTTSGSRTTVIVHQAGADAVARGAQGRVRAGFRRDSRGEQRRCINERHGDRDVIRWTSGSAARKTFDAELDFGGRKIAKIVLDPHCRFPDRDPSDNVWPRGAPLTQPATAARGGRAPVCSN